MEVHWRRRHHQHGQGQLVVHCQFEVQAVRVLDRMSRCDSGEGGVSVDIHLTGHNGGTCATLLRH